MRYFVDTNVFIYSLIAKHRLKKNVLQLLEDYENQIYVSSESIKEFIHLIQQNRVKLDIKNINDIFEYISKKIIGDSLLAVGDESLLRVHYHTNEPWQVLEYCASLGEIHDIVIENMERQVNGLTG
jgi:dihydroxyacetone kinase-like predicted kinase